MTMLLETLAIAGNCEEAIKKYQQGLVLSEIDMINIILGYGEMWLTTPFHRDFVPGIALRLLNWYPMVSNATLVHNCRKLSGTEAWEKAEKILSPKLQKWPKRGKYR